MHVSTHYTLYKESKHACTHMTVVTHRPHTQAFTYVHTLKLHTQIHTTHTRSFYKMHTYINVQKQNIHLFKPAHTHALIRTIPAYKIMIVVTSDCNANSLVMTL